ncbi:hypothetical protein [Microvirga sp. P5_D2]
MATKFINPMPPLMAKAAAASHIWEASPFAVRMRPAKSRAV